MKKTIALLMALGTLSCVFMGAGCGPTVVEKVDKTKTALRIANYNGGVGEKWLDELEDRFEAAYADVPFEEGKKGVDVVVDHSKDYDGKSIVDTLRADTDNHIYFTQMLDYQMMASQGLLADITDLVTKTIGDDGKKIEEKLSLEKKDFLQRNGKYYAIPHYELYSGIQYDAGVFASKKLYFADVLNPDGTTRPFITSPNSPKSCGPDGQYNTYDDGLPSSYEEFYRLIDQMIANDVIPFVWTGKSPHYTNMLLSTLFDNYIGADGYEVLLDFDAKEEDIKAKDIEIVTSYAGGVVQTKIETLTNETAYKVKSSAAMYRALEFCEKIFVKDSGYYPKSCTAAGYTHLDAQDALWNSGLDGSQYIAMLIDGNYSYNESVADGILTRLKEDYPTTYQKKDVRYMPMPVQYSGTVVENKGKSPVLVDNYMSYAFINANAKGAAVAAAEAFLSFAYTDEELKTFTLTTNGVVKGVNYDLKALANDATLCVNGKNMLAIREAAVKGDSLIFPFSSSKAFIENSALFDLTTGGAFWHAKDATIVYSAFFPGMKASTYFEQMQWTQAQWEKIIK